ncbi:putative aminoacyltransferase, E1 ubiquitin-activating enzyme [Medicago truncatula]|uniref:Putative aminoacyltransferase, E1 ubiquitin-activating enzyme n=2 Tax=Medicago truncatula TaxID=3880 RepID=G7JME6_MEDTR|nr:ubiquitin-conjugating enzyme [Medicago truncatula]RHN62222.1 putative aminoacyltransferase, E1 ubiquitin-activating enzyme [Medicago truncatula]
MEKKNTFEMVSDDSDHKFLSHNISGNCFRDTKSALYKRIMKEWKILENNLPDSIYVKAYETRIDLLRAVIVSAAGTPYHDGLFFFDIQFPDDYPNSPPKIHYHSFGYSLNPNLYPDGTVCLSLLNTWPSTKGEKWDPTRSTLLQLLVSIQALVLNECPLFNEPFYRIFKRSFHETKSFTYNEDVFVKTCHAAYLIIRTPPKNFEVFVKEHFRERGHVLLAACKEYVNGHVRVGYYGYNTMDSSSNRDNSSTVIEVRESFQVSLRSAYRRLYTKFKECGASLETFHHDLEFEVQVNAGSGICEKAMAMIKQALGWKKEST